jgi:branched-chain amino acid transport system permease protein
MQGFMPPEAFMFDTSGQLVMQTAIGGAGTLFGPLVGAAVWLYLSDFFQTTLHLGATWKLVLGVVFVLLVVFLRHGIVGGLASLWQRMIGGTRHSEPAESDPHAVAADIIAPMANKAVPVAALTPSPRRRESMDGGEVILETRGVSKRYGGVLANDNIDFSVRHGELRGVIGPNGAGKSTFFKILTCETHPTEGRILFEGRDITGFDVTEVCQLGLTKSYQVNQLFTRLTVRENITIAALAERRGPFRLDLLRHMGGVNGLTQRVEDTLALARLTERAGLPVSELAYGEKRRLEIGLALATAPSLLLLDEPLAGMSPRERLETIELLKSIAPGRTMIIIDHDMDAIFEIAQQITVLREGSVLVQGTPAEIRANVEVQEAYLGGVHTP